MDELDLLAGIQSIVESTVYNEQGTVNLAVDCIRSSISAKYLKLNSRLSESTKILILYIDNEESRGFISLCDICRCSCREGRGSTCTPVTSATLTSNIILEVWTEETLKVCYVSVAWKKSVYTSQRWSPVADQGFPGGGLQPLRGALTYYLA